MLLHTSKAVHVYNKKEDFRCAVEGFGRVENWVRLGSSWSREHSASG